MGAQIRTSTTLTWDLKYICRVWRLPSRQTNMKKEKGQIHHARHTCSHVCQAWWIWIYSFEWMYPHMLYVLEDCVFMAINPLCPFLSLSLSFLCPPLCVHFWFICIMYAGQSQHFFDSTPHCNTLQYTVTHCNTLRQHVASNSSRIQVAKMSSFQN